jgi:predicted small metal-binding protein
MVYNFICTLKGIDFKYKVEAENITEAKVKVREHIKNAVEIQEFIPEPKIDNSFMEFFNDMIKPK